MKNKIKNVARSLAVGLALTCAIPSAESSPSGTYSHKTVWMLNNATLLCVSNSTTASPAVSNFWYYGYYYGTNVLAGSTNANGILYGNPLVPAPIFPDGNGDVNPNLAIQLVAGYTNVVLFAPKQTPTMYNTVWTNPTSFFTNAATSIQGTNTITVTLFGVASGDWAFPDSGATIPTLKSFSFNVVQSNAVPVIVTTNLPIAFLQGLYAIWPTISSTNNGGTSQGSVIDALNLTGWSP